jgi:ATP-dependent helicase HrpB
MSDLVPPPAALSLPDVPIREALPALRAALRERPNAVLEAPPGAGKSTVVPLALLDEPWLAGRRILMLQPRRLAARAVARRLAATLGEEPGGIVGYRTRLESRIGPATRIEVLTEGILTRRLQRDPALEDAGIVLFDEFHERSLPSDLGLALALDAQLHLRPDLRLLVMSATLDGAAVARLLGPHTPVVRTQGRAFEVETRYAPPAPPTAGAIGSARPEPVELRAARLALRALESHAEGDVLVFLPGAREIRRACDALEQGLAGRGEPRVFVVPLYGELDARAQDEALRPAAAGRRKIVVATNLAETGLTIEGVRVVVDSGLERRARFDPGTGMSRLDTATISRASADQRRGRAGRTAPGTCYRLWSESAHAALAPQAPPEILEADLAPLGLELACWGSGDPSSLAWLDPPPPPMLAQARELLQRLEALDAHGHATSAGRRMAELGVHPRLAHMIERARELGLARTACELAALLSERDTLRPVQRIASASPREPDLRHALDVLHGGPVPSGFVADPRALQAVRRTADLLARRAPDSMRGDGAGPDATARDAAAGLLLAFAYPDRIGRSRGDEQGRYLLSGGRGAVLASPSTALARSEFLVAAELDAGEREARILRAAPLERALLERHCAGEIETAEQVHWDERSGAVVARRVRRLGALVLDERRLEGAAGAAGLAAMLEGVRRLGLEALPWTPELRQWQARVLLLRREFGAEAWPDVSDVALLDGLERWLAPRLAGVLRREHLARLDLREALQSLLDWNQRRRLDELAPTHVVVPTGSRIALDYGGASPVLAVRLQEVFGWQESPRIAGGRVTVTLALLSPAQRPVQVTSDLQSFWARGYAEVRKDLRGRYPKHHWPEDPSTATPTRRARPRGEPR